MNFVSLLDGHQFLNFVSGYVAVRSCAAVVKDTSIESLLRAGSRDSQADYRPTFVAGL